MRFRLQNMLLQMWHRIRSDSQCTAYIQQLQKFESNGFYKVYAGETQIPESLITGEIASEWAGLRSPCSWSIIHAGGSRGWVPWNYKLKFCSDGTPQKPNPFIFQELCSTMRTTYGKCVIITSPQTWQGMEELNYERPLYHFPLSSVNHLHMKCSPLIAQAYGHELLQLPYKYGHLNLLNSAWWTVNWFILNHREEYLHTYYYKNNLHKFIIVPELINGALNEMTLRKWEKASAKVLKEEQAHLNKH
ncbi:uncharacterized protein C21orf140 homolog [Hoplias malabaricus]|uniref:uncharacterized protein C21orf140 homolog n=1 Tax=Hoplias malabaricus TaxID=27720 RepID=UPI0034629E7F